MSIVKCRIADFNISFDTDIKCIDKLLREYISDFETPDIMLKLLDEDIELEKEYSDSDSTNMYLTTYKMAALFRKLGEELPSRESFVLHSACFDIGGVGVAFAAHSGTGKTTHMNLWQKLLGDKMVVVNGDKPIIRFFEDEPEIPYAYGTYWNGKEHLGCNMRTKLQHICFIERSKTNYVEEINKEDAIERIMKQVYMPRDSVAVVNTMQLVDRLLSYCKLWTIHCNMEDEAAEIAYNAIIRNS